ncbi:hypothetical protein [Micromonospora sp. SH-82]
MSNPGPFGQTPHVPPTPAPGWQPALVFDAGPFTLAEDAVVTL